MTRLDETRAESATLRGGALSLSAATLVGLGYCAIAVSAYAILPYAVAEAGGGGAFWGVILTTLALVPTAVCIYLMSSRRPSAGGSFTWISEGLGRWTGGTVGFVIVGFVGPLTALLQPAVGGQTINALLDLLGIHTSFWTGFIGAVVTVVICLLLVVNNVTLSTKAVAWLFGSEAVFMVLFFAFVIIKQSIAGVWLNPFSPSAFTSGTGFTSALVFVVFAVAVVDVPVSMAEETNEPHKNIPKMTALILGLVGLISLFSTYALSVAASPEVMEKDIANANEVGPVYLIADQFIGWGKIGVIITTYTSVMALFVATILFAGRFTHAMAREGMAPRWLGKIHPKTGTPRNAQVIFTVLGPVVVLLVGIWQGNSLANAYAWGGGIFSGLVLFTYTLINIGAIGFFLRRRALGEKYKVSLHLVVPLIGAAVSFWFLWNSFIVNYLKTGSDFATSGSIVLAVGIWLAIGAVYAGMNLAKRPKPASRSSDSSSRAS
ncbi:APC family permease [Arthrobacter sp. NyZ413]|uniref:APC family permease n=1 Tax=Arthrobacter sp. NyZ413 TaxID=3144669 RepID=UPI003BF7F751